MVGAECTLLEESKNVNSRDLTGSGWVVEDDGDQLPSSVDKLQEGQESLHVVRCTVRHCHRKELQQLQTPAQLGWINILNKWE